MKRFKSLSVVLASALLVSSIPMTTFGVTEGGEINGGGTIIDGYVLDVDVPTDVPFMVNPQEFGVQVSGDTLSGQIISPGYAFRNRSSMPVQLDIIPSFASADGITIVTSEDEILNTNNEGHKIYLEIQPASVKPTVNGDGVGEVSAPAITPAGNYATGPAITEEPDAKMSFKLDAASYVVSGNSVEYNPGSFASDDAIAFKFGGKVSKYSKWDGKVINVKVKYDFGTISDADYNDADNEVDGRYNVLNKDLLQKDPAIALSMQGTQGVITFVNTESLKLPTGDYDAQGLFFIQSDSPIDDTKFADITTISAGKLGDYTVIQMVPKYFNYNPSTGVVVINEDAVSASDYANKYYAYFVILRDKDGHDHVVQSGNAKFK